MTTQFSSVLAVGLGLSLWSGIFSWADAPTVEVGKVNGQRAIVTFSNGFTPQSGKVYEIREPGAFDEERKAGSSGSPRSIVLGGSLGFQSVTSELQRTTTAKDSVSLTNFDVDASFGWNFGYFELGPQFSYQSSKESGASNGSESRFNFGAFFDVNFLKNESGRAFIPGLRLEPMLTVFSNGTSSASGFDGSALLFGKWFLVDSAAFRPGLGYSISQVGSGVGSLKVSGLLVSGAFQIYF